MNKLFISILAITFLNNAANGQIPANDPALGLMILEEQKENIQMHQGDVDCINYWNIAVAYRHLGKSPDSIYHNLYKSMEDNPSKFIELVEFFISNSGNEIKNLPFYKILGDRFIKLVDQGKNMAMTNNVKLVGKIDYILNQEVVDSLIAMMEWDQKYRLDPNFFNNAELRKRQYILDSLNSKRLYALYKKYGYPGASLTGDNEYKDYFCLMVEHGQNKSGEQRFWLPIIAEAFKKEELSGSVFKMLLDRIHWLETNKQYFGSHHGVELESKVNIEKVKYLYGL